jgi:hypothetical protein
MPPLHARWDACATRDGSAHGILLWFDSDLTASISLSNAPDAPPALYGQAFFPFRPAITLRQGDALHIELRAVRSGDDYAWRWSARAEDGRSVRHATLLALPLDPAALVLRAEQSTPRRSSEGEILRALLDAADGRATFGDLARILHERFAARFPTMRSALDYVTSVDDLWAR